MSTLPRLSVAFDPNGAVIRQSGHACDAVGLDAPPQRKLHRIRAGRKRSVGGGRGHGSIGPMFKVKRHARVSLRTQGRWSDVTRDCRCAPPEAGLRALRRNRGHVAPRPQVPVPAIAAPQMTGNGSLAARSGLACRSHPRAGTLRARLPGFRLALQGCPGIGAGNRAASQPRGPEVGGRPATTGPVP